MNPFAPHHRPRGLRFVLAIAALTSLPTSLSAQYLKLKIGGGLASQYGDAKVVGAYKIGIGYEYEFDQHWTFTPSLVFYGKGWKDPDVDVPVVDDNGQPRYDEAGNRLYSRMSRSVAADYVEIPLLFSYYYRTGEGRYLVFGAGPYAAVGVAGKAKVKGNGERIGSEKLYYDGNTFSEEGAHRFDAGVQGLVGYQFPSGLTLGVEADFGLLRFKTDGGRNVSALISLSYKFD